MQIKNPRKLYNKVCCKHFYKHTWWHFVLLVIYSSIPRNIYIYPLLLKLFFSVLKKLWIITFFKKHFLWKNKFFQRLLLNGTKFLHSSNGPPYMCSFALPEIKLGVKLEQVPSTYFKKFRLVSIIAVERTVAVLLLIPRLAVRNLEVRNCLCCGYLCFLSSDLVELMKNTCLCHKVLLQVIVGKAVWSQWDAVMQRLYYVVPVKKVRRNKSSIRKRNCWNGIWDIVKVYTAVSDSRCFTLWVVEIMIICCTKGVEGW